MTEVHILIFFCTGIFLFFIPVLFPKSPMEKTIKWIFIIGIFLNILLLLLKIPLGFSFAKTLLSYPFHKVSTFVLGGYLTVLIASLFFNKKTDEDPNMNSLIVQTSLLMATYFFGTGIGKFIGWKSMLSFFELSGYNSSFLIFIAIVEIGGAIALLVPSIRKYAALLLFCNMIGATYTHYHNYFVSNIPDPFGNSIDSLKMQPFLILIIIVGFGLLKQKTSKEL